MPKKQNSFAKIIRCFLSELQGDPPWLSKAQVKKLHAISVLRAARFIQNQE